LVAGDVVDLAGTDCAAEDLVDETRLSVRRFAFSELQLRASHEHAQEQRQSPTT
jgi:hypothetical protein